MAAWLPQSHECSLRYYIWWLALEEFVDGYGQILQSPDTTEMERSARLEHLVSLMYFAQQYEWQAVLSFHAPVILEIKRDLLKWGNSLFHLESSTLYGHPKMPKSSTSGGSSTSSTTVLYCQHFQRQQCSFNQAHYGYLRGKRKWLQHICSDCWVQSRKQEHHHTGSSECTLPLQVQRQKN